ncbi:MAG: glycoside hydrolase family 97 N-terminal domain-containing protein, partial [Bacteroidales bacterium]|nr:glycoside hydrolase family 97 N-terminal domain-containing protein [Bacteroidales bacterium]
MKRFLLLLVSSAAIGAMAQDVTSPDGRLLLQVQSGAVTTYRVTFDGHTVLEPSPIGLIANYAD